MLLVTL